MVYKRFDMSLCYALLGLALFILRTEGGVDRTQNNGTQGVSSKKAGANKTTGAGVRPSARASDADPTEKEKKDYVKELESDIATVIADNIQIAITTIAEKGDIFNDNETKEFFETVAGHVLTQIEDRIETLKELVQDQDLVARGIAEDIAKKITKDVNSQTMTEIPSNVKDNVIAGGVIGIPKEIEIFIKQILTNPA